MSHLSISISRHQTKASCHLFKTTLSSCLAAEKRRHQQSFPCAGGTQYGAVVNYRRRVCQTYSEAREERAACSGLQQQGKVPRKGKASRCAWLYPARCGRAMAFEMMGHDWVAATRVHLFVQPGVPPLLFVSEGRWGPECLPQGWEDWEGGKERAPRPHARPHRSSVQCTLPPACLGWVLCVL